MPGLSKTLAMLGMLAPFGASAMGIGDIRSQSGLNQALQAEIPLVLSGADKLENIQVRLASPEAFDKAGVERPPALTQLRFKPVARQDGRYVIEVSSREVIQEPFLDFLVEVESPQGTLLREFTLLLDPPRDLSQAYPGREAAPYPTAPRYAPGFDHDEPAYTRRGSMAPPSAYPDLDTAPYARPTITPEQLTSRTYGPVQRGETLINIAARLERPDGVSAGQMANALYLANPQAFSGNLHSLLAGSVLRIPGDEFISQTLGQGAHRSAANRSSSASLRDLAEASRAAAPMGHSGSSGAVADVSARIPAALKRENEELRERLAQLEQRLTEAQRMLELKNAELATLQSHHAEAATPQERSVQQTEPVPDTPDAAPAVIAPAAPPTTPAALTTPSPTVQPQPAVAPQPQAAIPAEEHSLAPGFWLAGSGLTLLGVGAWMYRRRRLAGEPDTETEIRTPAPEPAATGEPWQDPLATPVGFTPPTYALETPVLETSALDPLWEADIYLRYGRFSQAENLIREAIGQHPEQHDLKRKLFEILGLANNPAGFKAYAQELQAGGTELPVGFWAAIDDVQPGWLPPEIIRDPQPAAANSPMNPQPLEASEPDLATQFETLDIEDTDFTAELRALEEQYARQSSAASARASAMSQEDAAASPVLTPSDLPVSGSAPIELAGGSTDLDVNDTDFTAELRALEAQYSPGTGDRGADQATPNTPDASLATETPAAGSAQHEPGNLMEFVPPSREELQSASQTRREPAAEPTLENLIDFEAPSDLAASRAKLTNDHEGRPDAVPLDGAAELDDLFEIPPLKGLAPAGRNSRFGLLDFELELIDPSRGAPAGNGSPSGATFLEQARRHAAKGEKAAAREALQEVLRHGTPDEKSAAEQLLNELAIVRLSLVPPVPRDAQADSETMVLPKVKPGP